MHFYWKIREELKYLGEELVFQDPGIKRSFKKWCMRHGLYCMGLEFVDPPNYLLN